MKRIFIYILICMATFTACQKDKENAFDKSSDERLNAALAAYQTQLTSAPNGWKAVVRPNAGGRYSFFFRFNTANRVFMFSDYQTLSAGTRGESSYRLKALQQPSLIFDTYSYLHTLSDPDPNVNNGETGQGLGADFEFYFESSSSPDSIKLVGRVNNTKLTLVRATAAEASAYESGQLAKFTLMEDGFSKILQYWKNATINGVVYDVKVDASGRTITFTWKDGAGVIRSFTTTYYITLDGIFFDNPFVNGATNISSFSAITFDANTNVIGVTSNSIQFNVAGANTPAANDVNSPANWRNLAVANDSTYWYSIYGFTINGVPDAHNLLSLTEPSLDLPYYYYMVYWPQFNPGEDFSGPIYLNTAQDQLNIAYGLAIVPGMPGNATVSYTFTDNGYSYGTYPTTGPAASYAAQLYNPGGYYFQQVGDLTYDMVSKTDSRIWIRWNLAL